MHFLLFNIILFGISYVVDYVGVHIFHIVEWSESYLYYLILVNIPLSLILTYMAMRKIKGLIE